MTDPSSSLCTGDQALLERSLKAVDATKEILRDFTRHEESIAQVEPRSDQQRNESIFQRQKIKGIPDSALVFQQVLVGGVDSLRPSSPIGLLPVEILLEIFSLVVADDAEYRREQMEKCGVIRFKGIPMVLAHVCSQWRATVHQDPSLWKHIQIPPYWLTEPEHLVHRTARWIAQGIQQKQSLFIEYWHDSEMDRLISYIGSHTTPWVSIDLAPMYDDRQGGWDLMSVQATKVKVYQRHGSRTTLTFFLPLLRNARELTVMGTSPVWGNPPWTSLISLRLQPFASKSGKEGHLITFGALKFRELLKAAPRLKELELDFRERVQIAGPYVRLLPRTVEHQAINSLSVHLRHFSDDMGLFGLQPNFPALQSLTILSLGPSSSFMGGTEEELGSRRWDQLRLLSLYDLEIAGLERALRLFVHLPKVDTLNLTGAHVNALVSLMNALYRQVGPPSREPPLPQLARVVLRSTDIKGGTLVDMVETRLVDMRVPVTIQRITDVEIYDSPGVTVEEWKCIQTLLEKGHSAIQIDL
jgi:F-box-like